MMNYPSDAKSLGGRVSRGRKRQSGHYAEAVGASEQDGRSRGRRRERDVERDGLQKHTQARVGVSLSDSPICKSAELTVWRAYSPRADRVRVRTELEFWQAPNLNLHACTQTLSLRTAASSTLLLRLSTVLAL